jgi:hypothetical protein
MPNPEAVESMNNSNGNARNDPSSSNIASDPRRNDQLPPGSVSLPPPKPAGEKITRTELTGRRGYLHAEDLTVGWRVMPDFLQPKKEDDGDPGGSSGSKRSY